MEQQPANQTPPPGQYGQDEGNVPAVLGLIFSILFWPVGLIFSILGLQKAEQLAGKKGYGLALAGIIIAAVGCLLTLLVLPVVAIFIAAPALQRDARDARRRSDVSLIRSAVDNYAASNTGALPVDADEFSEALTPGALSHYSGERQDIAGDLSTLDATLYFVVWSDASPAAADLLPDIDQVHIFTGAVCGRESVAILVPEVKNKYGSPGFSGLLEEGHSGTFAAVYQLETDSSIQCS